MKLISRVEAIKNGLTKYYTGKPCSRGHIEERYTSSGSCHGCSLENNAVYQKKRRGNYLKAKEAKAKKDE